MFSIKGTGFSIWGLRMTAHTTSPSTWARNNLCKQEDCSDFEVCKCNKGHTIHCAIWTSYAISTCDVLVDGSPSFWQPGATGTFTVPSFYRFFSYKHWHHVEPHPASRLRFWCGHKMASTGTNNSHQWPVSNTEFSKISEPITFRQRFVLAFSRSQRISRKYILWVAMWHRRDFGIFHLQNN